MRTVAKAPFQTGQPKLWRVRPRWRGRRLIACRSPLPTPVAASASHLLLASRI